MQLVTFEGSGITKLADLKGKRVSTGAVAGGTEVSVPRVFEAPGMDIDRDIRRERLVLTLEGWTLLCAGQTDAT